MKCSICGEKINPKHHMINYFGSDDFVHLSCFHANEYGEIVDLDRGYLVKPGGILIKWEGEEEEEYNNVIPIKKR